MWTTGAERPVRLLALGLALVTLIGVTGLVGFRARGWIGRTFPGFFVLPNRVVASVGAPGWIEGRTGALFQREVIAVDERRMTDAGDVYAAVAARPSGATFAVRVRDGAREASVVLPARAFTAGDYWAIFGPYLGTGLLYGLAGLLAFAALPGTRLGASLLAVGVVAGTYALTGVGIYDTTAVFSIHIVAEALLPAALIAVATELAGAGARLAAVAVAARWLSVALAVPYVLLAAQPAAYATLHAAGEAYMGLAGVLLVGSVVVTRTRGARLDPLTRLAGSGALLGIGVPAVVFALSGLCGGLPVNVCTATGFLFPLGILAGLARAALRPVAAPGEVPLAAPADAAAA